jgi:hypothetical protein
MKRVLILSIQHTGTFFASSTIASAYPNSHLRIGSLYDKHRKLNHKRFVENGAIELSDFCKPSDVVDGSMFEQTVSTVCTPEDVAGKEIVIGHEHFHKADSWILKALHKAPAQIPIVVPVRDPILSLHSKIWREVEQHNNAGGTREKPRMNRLKKWIAMYKDILSIPEGHVFKLPIDAEQSKTEESRIKLIKDLCAYCNVPFNESCLEKTLKWKPENRTYKVIEKEKKKTPHQKWENFKERYNKGDLNYVKKVMDIEFQALNRDNKLKDLMKEVGYKDVLWW